LATTSVRRAEEAQRGYFANLSGSEGSLIGHDYSCPIRQVRLERDL
jgi:hypothetical protein